MIKEVILNNLQTNTQTKPWVLNKQKLGNISENIFLEYLKQQDENKIHYKHVSEVDDSLGYDYLVQQNKETYFYEIKTLNKYTFYISANEIETMKRKGKNYRLFLVEKQVTYSNEETYIGYIIRDPYNILNLNTVDIQIKRQPSFSIGPVSYVVILNTQIIKEFDKIIFFIKSKNSEVIENG